MHSAGKMLVFCNVFVISLIVHALYADASSWAKVIPLLQAKGLHVTAVQNPTTSLEADVDAVKRTLALQDGPTLLVAHSYGGMVISQAGDDPKVKGLVYVAARAPDAGEDYPALTRKFAPVPAGAGLQWSADGYGLLSEQAFVHDFAGDCRCRKPACISPFSSQWANLSPWQRPPWRLGTTSDLVRVAAPLSLQNRRSLNSVVMKILIIEDEAKTACLETATGRRLRSGAMARSASVKSGPFEKSVRG